MSAERRLVGNLATEILLLPVPLSDMTRPKVVCSIKSVQRELSGGLLYYVVAETEEGEKLSHHYSSSVGWAKDDITSDSNKKLYSEKYPEGYEISWADSPLTPSL
jgi:hypothetical protein